MVYLVKQNYKENKKMYKRIEHNLRKILPKDVQIEHVGSTAIPSMYGKNIIDVLIGVENNSDFENISNILEDNNYIPSEKSKTDTYQFFASTSNETESGDTHIHLVIKNTQRFNDFIILRNYLLNDKKEAKNYSDLKRKLIKDGVTDRKEYKKKKSEYVSNLLDRARKFIDK